MSNRNNCFLEFRGTSNPQNRTISPIINNVGNVRLSYIYLPHTFKDARNQGTRNQISITAETITHIVQVEPSNFQDPTKLAQLIGCEFKKELTGFSEDVIAGYNPEAGKLNVRSALFDVTDSLKAYPLPGTMSIVINNTDLMWDMAGFTTSALTPNIRHEAANIDKLFKYEFIYFTSPELVNQRSNDIRLDGEPADTVFVGILDQGATNRRIVQLYINDIQVFYQNTTPPLGKALGGVYTLAARYRDGTLIDFEGAEWRVVLRIDPAVQQT